MSKRPAIIVISSHVARGSVGNRAAVFALETLGFPVWAIPTITLPWHPGHSRATALVPAKAQFEAFMKDIEEAPWIEEVGAVLTGYMARDYQVTAVAETIQALKRRKPELIHLCDPVIGDEAGLYVAEETASAIRDAFLPICNIATPNLYELAWLQGVSSFKTFDEMVEGASAMAAGATLVTSAITPQSTQTGNYLHTERESWMATHPVVQNPPNGPGDLTAAVALGHVLEGFSWAENLQRTTASVYEILVRSRERASDELTLETDAASLKTPTTDVALKKL